MFMADKKGIGWLSVDFLPIAFQALGLTG